MGDKVKAEIGKKVLARVKSKVENSKKEKDSEENRTWGSGVHYDGRHRKQD